MEAFAQRLRDMGYEDVRLIDTAKEAFGSRRRAALMMLGIPGCWWEGSNAGEVSISGENMNLRISAGSIRRRQ